MKQLGILMWPCRSSWKERRAKFFWGAVSLLSWSCSLAVNLEQGLTCVEIPGERSGSRLVSLSRPWTQPSAAWPFLEKEATETPRWPWGSSGIVTIFPRVFGGFCFNSVKRGYLQVFGQQMLTRFPSTPHLLTHTFCVRPSTRCLVHRQVLTMWGCSAKPRDTLVCKPDKMSAVMKFCGCERSISKQSIPTVLWFWKAKLIYVSLL